MKIICGPRELNVQALGADLRVILYSQADIPALGSVGPAVQEKVAARKLAPAPRASDLLSIAMAAVTADLAGYRTRSPDGWTRVFDLTVALADPAFWNTQAELIAQLLNYLTCPGPRDTAVTTCALHCLLGLRRAGRHDVGPLSVRTSGRYEYL